MKNGALNHAAFPCRIGSAATTSAWDHSYRTPMPPRENNTRIAPPGSVPASPSATRFKLTLQPAVVR
jgi:hypothetical protein